MGQYRTSRSAHQGRNHHTLCRYRTSRTDTAKRYVSTGHRVARAPHSAREGEYFLTLDQYRTSRSTHVGWYLVDSRTLVQQQLNRLHLPPLRRLIAA
eukprot:1086440-Rhodomonas_salina.1